MKPSRVFIIAETQLQRETATAWLATRGLAADRTLRPRDIDEMRAAASEPATVVFASAELFLAALWERRLGDDTWAGLDVMIADDARTALPPAVIAATWRDWSRAAQRRQTIAASVMTLVVVAAACALLWLTR